MRPSLPIHVPIAALAALALTSSCSDSDNGPSAPPLQIIGFDAKVGDDNVDNVDAGQRVTLSWNVAGAVNITVEQDPGSEIISKEANPNGDAGSVESPPLNLDTRFTLTVTDAAGQTATQMVEVTVTGINIVSFTASPMTIGRGEESVLSWSLGGSDPSEVVIFDSNDQAVLAAGTVLRQGEVTVQPEMTETYTLRAQAGGVQAEQTITVTVTSMPPTVSEFAALALVNGTPTAVTEVAIGTQVQLTWTVANATEIQVSVNGRVFRPWTSDGAMTGTSQNANTRISDAQTVFLLEARNGPNPEDISSQELTIGGLARPSVLTFDVTPTEYTTGSTIATATWTTQNADGTRLQLNGTDVPGFTREPNGTFMFDVTGEVNVTLVARNRVADDLITRRISFGFNDMEPNNTSTQAIALPGDGLPVRGTVSPTDSDFYSVTASDGGFITARIDAPLGGTCDVIRATLTLIDDQGNELGSRNTVGNTCPEILPPEFSGFAENLTAGTYFIRVSQDAAAISGQYSLAVRSNELGAPLPTVQTSTVMTPEWTVTDFILVTTPWGTQMNNFAERLDNIRALLGTRHLLSSTDPVIYINSTPQLPSPSDFTQELRIVAQHLGLESKTSFTNMEWSNPNGIFLGFTIVPTSTTTGTSVDFPAGDGPFIRNGLLPITLNRGALLVNGMEARDFSAMQAINGSPAADGLSHVNVIVSGADILIPPAMAPTPPFNAQWVVELRDQTMSGYDINVSFSVTP